MRNARQQMFAGAALALAGAAVTVLSFFWPIVGYWYLWGGAIAGGATMFARAQGNYERLREDDARTSQRRGSPEASR